MANPKAKCRHIATTSVAHRMDEVVDKDGQVIGYQLTIRAWCRNCKEIFSFPTLMELQTEVAWRPGTRDCFTELVVPARFTAPPKDSN